MVLFCDFLAMSEYLNFILEPRYNFKSGFFKCFGEIITHTQISMDFSSLTIVMFKKMNREK